MPNRKDFEENQILIRSVYLDFLRNKKRAPTYRELTEATGLTKKTISKHLKTISFDKIITKSRALTEDVLLAILKSA